MLHKCDQCGESFTQKCHLNRHKESKHGGVKYSCDKCSYSANRRDNLNRHMKKKHAGDVEAGPHLSPEKEKTGGDVGGEHDVDHEGWLCDQCGQEFSRKDYLITHLKKHEKENAKKSPTKIKTRLRRSERIFKFFVQKQKTQHLQ